MAKVKKARLDKNDPVERKAKMGEKVMTDQSIFFVYKVDKQYVYAHDGEKCKHEDYKVLVPKSMFNILKKAR